MDVSALLAINREFSNLLEGYPIIPSRQGSASLVATIFEAE